MKWRLSRLVEEQCEQGWRIKCNRYKSLAETLRKSVETAAIANQKLIKITDANEMKLREFKTYAASEIIEGIKPQLGQVSSLSGKLDQVLGHVHQMNIDVGKKFEAIRVEVGELSAAIVTNSEAEHEHSNNIVRHLNSVGLVDEGVTFGVPAALRNILDILQASSLPANNHVASKRFNDGSVKSMHGLTLPQYEPNVEKSSSAAMLPPTTLLQHPAKTVPVSGSHQYTTSGTQAIRLMQQRLADIPGLVSPTVQIGSQQIAQVNRVQQTQHQHIRQQPIQQQQLSQQQPLSQQQQHLTHQQHLMHQQRLIQQQLNQHQQIQQQMLQQQQIVHNNPSTAHVLEKVATIPDPATIVTNYQSNTAAPPALQLTSYHGLPPPASNLGHGVQQVNAIPSYNNNNFSAPPPPPLFRKFNA